MLVVIGTDYTDSGKSNYHTIKTTINLKNFRSNDNRQLTQDKTRQDKTKAVTDRNVGSGLGQALNVTVLKLLLLLLLYNIYIAHYITITLSTSHYKTIKII